MDIINAIVSYWTEPIGLIVIISGLSVAGLIGLGYSKYRNHKSQGNIDISFPKYLQGKTRLLNPRKKQKTVLNTDKALEMIDEILKENK